jgi:FkbM family methyltransferase
MLRLPIVARTLRGYWWLPSSRGKLLRVLSGRYEPEQTAQFLRWVKPGATVIDVGAHVGYYTLLASVLVGETGSVWAFEPDPTNARFLRHHVDVNRCENAHVEELAVSDADGSSRFRFGTGSGTGRLDKDGQIDVRTIRLGQFCAARGIMPAALKIDVEGGEVAVLAGAAEIIAQSRPVIFLSTHSAAAHDKCLSMLRAAGYSIEQISGGDVESEREVLAVPSGRPG